MSESNDSIQNERLLGLEGTVRDIAFKTGHIEASQVHLLSKLEEGFAGLQESNKLISVKQEDLNSRIIPLEQDRASKAKTWGIVKKLVIPAISATAGVFGVKFGSNLLELIAKLFQ